MKSHRFFLILASLIITIIILSCFGRTIGGYFLEDDLGEVFYVHQIFSGHWQQIISNFTGNYMSIPTMKVYRPCLLLSIMADYALWKTNASGYFATNIFFLIASAIALYAVLIELTRSWDRPRSILFALFSALLFASSPLHCESVSLMVGRVDIICAFFFLLALWSFIRKGGNKNWPLTLMGISCFWIALLTKEMAIALPIILPVITFLFPDVFIKKSQHTTLYKNEQITSNIYHRLILTFRINYPLWLSCIIYFVIRYLALGTFFGGYVGSVGASQLSHILEKWTDLDTVYRIIFPLNQAVFAPNSFYRSALFIVYGASAVLIFARFVISGLPRTWLLLLFAWLITALAPIYQLWGLGFNLEGARFLFFLTIPLAIFLPLLIFAPANNNNATNQNSPLSHIKIEDLKILIPGVMALCALVFLDASITTKNNIPWIHAGKQIRALLQEGQKLAQTLKSDNKAVVLGIPKDIDGAHVIYNGFTFNFLMSPPFSADNYAKKFITFDPILFGNANLINTSRFKETIASPNINSYVWQPDKMIFCELPLLANKQADEKALLLSLPSVKTILLPYTVQRGSWQLHSDSLNISKCEKGAGIAIGPLSLNPFAYDFLEIEAATTPSISPKQLNVFWHDDYLNPSQSKKIASALYTSQALQNEPSSRVGVYKTYRIALSRHWRWFTEKEIQGLWLEFPPLESISIKSMRLISDKSLVPKLAILERQTDNTGVYPIDQNGISLQIDTNQINNCATVKLEVTRPNYFFDNFDGDNIQQAILTTTIINNKSDPFFLDSKTFPSAGFYQLRIIALDKNGDIAGEWSDPITIKYGLL